MMADPTSALSSRNYRKFLLGNFLSVLGVWIQRLALGWHAWQLSESALIVGVTAAAQFVPAVVLTPFFGVVVDQVSTRGAAVVLHIFLAAVAALLALLTLSGHMTTEWLIGLALANGIVQSKRGIHREPDVLFSRIGKAEHGHRAIAMDLQQRAAITGNDLAE